MPFGRRSAFTLIELLVVITIIVVLVALLTPALDQAIYQAELAVCGAKLRGLANSAAAYTADFSRKYPIKPAVMDRRAAIASELRSLPPAHGPYDVRPILKDHFNFNGSMNCPLIGEVDLVDAGDLSQVISKYAPFYGWRYNVGNTLEKGMFKVGDRFEWTDPSPGGGTWRFNVLASDWEAMHFEKNWVQSSHPDEDGTLEPVTLQNAAWEAVEGTGAGYVYTISMWIRGGRAARGSIDRNFAYDDGSVERFADVRQSTSNEMEMDDPRLVSIPWRANNADATVARMWLPRN